MSEIFGDSELGEDPGPGSESGYVAQLGRISGKLLKENLIRNGADLTFRNSVSDPDLLYLDVNNMRVGVNTDTPVYDLDINSNVKTNFASVTGQLNVDNVIINAAGYFSTQVGALHIMPTNGEDIFYNRIVSDALDIKTNVIGSLTNQNIVLNPNGTGTIELQADTFLTGDLSVTGNIVVDGDLGSASTIIVGDNVLDVVSITPDFTQSIIPGTHNLYDLGTPLKRWNDIYSPDMTQINNVIPGAAVVSGQVHIDGINRNIFAIQSNEDLLINPSTGVNYIEQIKIEGNNLTNLVSVSALNPTAVGAGMLAALSGDPSAAFWFNPASGDEYFLGGGSTVVTTRIAQLGDIRNDLDNPGVINPDDAALVTEISNRTSGTLNEQLWYHNVIKPYIYGDVDLIAEYTNGEALTNAPFTLGSTGTGYVRFVGTNGMVIPSGTSAERSYTEVGETRWNTELQYLECYDGNIYIIATGPGEVVSTDLMTDLSITRALLLG